MVCTPWICPLESEAFMVEVIVAILVALAVLAGGAGWYYYDKHLGQPKARLKALETSLRALAEHNVDITYDGSSRRIEQAAPRNRKATKELSVLDVLDQHAPINQGGDWKKLTFHEGFHAGPYAHELTDAEWRFIHHRYAELIQEVTSHRLTLESQRKVLKETEVRMQRMSKTYAQEAKRLAAEQQETHQQRWKRAYDDISEDRRDA